MSTWHIVLTVWGIGVGLVLLWASLNYFHSNKKFVQCSATELKPAGYRLCCVRETGHKGKHRSFAGREF